MITVLTWNGYDINSGVYDTCIDSLMYDNAPVQAETRRSECSSDSSVWRPW